MKRNVLKRTVAGIVAVNLVFGTLPMSGLPVNLFDRSELTIKAVDVELTDISNTVAQSSADGSTMKYNISYGGLNVKGKYNGSYIQTTYDDEGYISRIKVGDSEAEELSAFKYGKVYEKDGVQIRITASLENEGKIVALKYEVHNKNDESKSVQFGSSADTKIGNNDSAHVEITDDGILMEDNRSNSSTYGAFYRISSGDGGFSTAWIGHWRDAKDTKYFDNLPVGTEYNNDSGVAWSWISEIGPHETVTKTATMQIARNLKIKNTSVTADLDNNQLKMVIPYEDGPDLTQTLHYKIDNNNEVEYSETKNTTETSGNNTFNVNLTASGDNSLGWTPNTDHTVEVWITNDNYVSSKKYKYNVHWDNPNNEGETKTLKFSSASGNLFADVNAKSGTIYKLPEDTMDGKVFKGWSKVQNDGSDLLNGNYTIENNETLYAYFVNGYTLSFNVNGGTAIGSTTVESGQTIAKPADPTRNGYTFDGWYTNNNYTEEFDFTSPITANKTVYAKWNENHMQITPVAGLVFDKAEHALVTVAPSPLPENVSIKYAVTGTDATSAPTEDSEWSTDIPSAVNAGSYKVWYAVASTDNNYFADTGSVTTTIAKLASTVTDFSCAPTEVTYDGTAKSAVVELVEGITGMGDITVVYSSDDGTTWTETAPTSAGTYKVGVKTAEGINYTATADGTVITDDNWTLNIKKAPIAYTAAGYNGVYDGNAHGITVTVTDPEDTTVTYCATEGGTYSEEPILFTDAADAARTVFFKIEKSNYNTVSGSAEVIIAPKELGVEWSNTSLTYNGQAQKPTVGVTGLVNDDICTVTVTGEKTDAGEYTATVSVSENDNYKLPAANTTAFTISKANVTIAEAPSAAGIVYEKSLADSKLTGGTVLFGETPVKGTVTWKDGTVKPSVADGGKTKYAVVFTPEDNKNFNAAACEITLAVAKAVPKYTEPKDLKITYGKTLKDVTLPEGWKWNDTADTKLEELGDNVYKATFTPKDTANYNTVTKDLTILVYVDKTALKKAISDTEAYTKDFDEEYHTRIFKDLNKALKNGKKVDESLTVTQDQIDTATADLEEALAYAKKLVNEINHVQGLIDAIGEISYTDECKAKIDAARKAYDALLFNQQMLVKNYQVLVDAESEYEKLGIEKYRIIKVSGKAATHTESGLKTYWKQDGFNYEDDKCTKKIDDLETWIVIPAEGHNWGEWVVKTPATCTESGLAVRTCEDDGATETKVIPATGEHKFGEWKVKKAPTCTENGIEERVCAECGKTETREIKATGEHKYGKPVYTWSEDGKSCTATAVCEVDKKITVTETAEVTSAVKTAATCDKAGVTTYTAKFKNELFSAQTKDVEDIPATGHKYGTPVYTWSEDGKSCTATAVCETDKKFTVTETVEVTSAVKTPATCDKAGVTTYTAKFKNDLFSAQTKDVEDIPATGHKYGKPVYTWSEDGKSCTATAICETDKKFTVTETVEVTSAVKIAATCDKAGVTTYTATFKNELFSAQTKDVEDIPATGHKFGEWTVTKEATDEADGYETRKCEYCGEEETHEILAKSHVMGEWKTIKAATCLEDGIEERACADCDKTETRVIKAAGEHKFGEWTVAKKATCEETGLEVRKCENCGEEETRVIPATGHKFGEWQTVTKLTDDVDGLEVRVCEHCGREEARATLATGHEFGEWKVTEEPTCEKSGIETRYCDHNDGTFETREIPAIGHKYGAPVYTWSEDGKTCTATVTCEHDKTHVISEKAVITSAVKTAATCDNKGVTTYTATFKNELFSVQTKDVEDIPATGHKFGTPVYTWSADGSTCTAIAICETDKKFTVTEDAVITSAVKTAATCDKAGVTTYTALFKNELFTVQTKDVEDIPALGHKLGTPVYTWSEDGKTCTATATCEIDKTYTVTEKAKITSAVKTAATCDKAGVTTYTAAFENKLFSAQTKDVADIPALGHKLGAPVYTWSEDGKTCTATATCENDKTYVVTETAKITSVVAAAATCDKAGVTTYTASFENKLFSTQTKDVADIPATGEHKFGGWHVTITANAEHDGTKEHKCEVCGLTETASTSYDYHESADEVTDPENKPGEIRNITEPETNACSGTIEVTDKKEIIDTFPLTNEECDQVENGKDIGLKLEVTDISENEGVKEKANEAVKETVGENGVVAAVLDVSIHKYIEGHDAGRVTQLNKVLRVYIDLPAGLYKEGRTFYVVREHEGKYEALPLTLVSETRAYFESDQYSQFYIVYTEEPVHEHEFGEWKTSQNASWLHRGYEERTCECGEKETRRVEESWTEWLVGAVGRRLRNLFR